MAHFKITLPTSPGVPGCVWPGSEARIELNGMDISASVGRCTVHLDANDVARVALDVAAASLEIEGDAAPEVVVALFGQPKPITPQRLPLQDGGFVEFREARS